MAYYDIEYHSRRVTTANEDAQRWFDRGLVWTYAYNHEEALSCFRTALSHDPDCAMAHWGVAYAAGPNYNLEWHHLDPESRAAALADAYDATAAAMARREGLTRVERALIEALPARYPQREIARDMADWNDAYAEAMRAVYREHADDLDVATLFVEAILNRTPWQMWDLETGAPTAGADTAEAQDVLERAMAEDPAAMRHPGILHLYVHLMEMSPVPEKALKAGDALRTLVPDAGHLVHMPTHIDVLCGNYIAVLESNQRAVEADRTWYRANGAANIYTGYRLHNYHFVIYGALFLGRYAPAIAAAEEMPTTVPEEVLRVTSPPMADFLESYLSMKPHVLIRFGRWREILAEPLPADPALYQVGHAMLRYARGIAHAALGEVAEAEAEHQAFLAAMGAVQKRRYLHNVRALDLCAIADAMLAGEIAYRKGDCDTAFAELRRAVALDDALPYDEPWGWMQPTRHALGALLLEQGRVDEAEAVYREDLGLGGRLPRAVVHPDNVWSLRGLYDCLTRRGETAEARLIKQRLDLAEARADSGIRVSCFCATAA
ncbi:MAG: hypothetical protein ACFBSD_06460 [Paracoccaceae bacterium]